MIKLTKIMYLRLPMVRLANITLKTHKNCAYYDVTLLVFMKLSAGTRHNSRIISRKYVIKP